MPATNLALVNIALVIRLMRSGVREALLMDYVKFARAKGLTNARVIGVHVLRNILIPIVTVIGLEFGSVIARGTPAEVLAHPRVISSYLGSDEETIRRSGTSGRSGGSSYAAVAAD